MGTKSKISYFRFCYFEPIWWLIPGYVRNTDLFSNDWHKSPDTTNHTCAGVCENAALNAPFVLQSDTVHWTMHCNEGQTPHRILHIISMTSSCIIMLINYSLYLPKFLDLNSYNVLSICYMFPYIYRKN